MTTKKQTTTERIRGSFKLDSFSNAVSNIGNPNFDKRLAAKPFRINLDQETIEDLYSTDPIAKRRVDRPVQDMFREGFKVFNEDEEITRDIESILKEYKLLDKAQLAAVYGLMMGGGAIVFGSLDGTDSEPLNPRKKDSLGYAVVLTRYELNATEIDLDLTSPNFGLPLMYTISKEGLTANVHYSRVVRFEGETLPPNKFKQNNYWHDSVLNKLYIPLLNYNQVSDAAASLVQTLNFMGLKKEGFDEILTSGDMADRSIVRNVINSFNQQLSINNMAVLDSKDELFTLSRSVAGLTEILAKVESRLVMASDLPHTIILGEGSQGNTSGRSEQSDYYDLIAQEQKSFLEPKLKEILKIVLPFSETDFDDLDIDDVDIVFNSLYQMDDLEKANIYKVYSEADDKYIANGVLTPEDVARRFETPEFNTSLMLDLQARMNFSFAEENNANSQEQKNQETDGAITSEPN